MGFLSKVFGAKPKPTAGPPPVEWEGATIEVELETFNEADWLGLMDGQSLRNRWADLKIVPNRNGKPKLQVSVGGLLVGELAYHALSKREEDLVPALHTKVNVGVVRLRIRPYEHEGRTLYGDIAATLFLGAGYKYRPKPAWT